MKLHQDQKHCRLPHHKGRPSAKCSNINSNSAEVRKAYQVFQSHSLRNSECNHSHTWTLKNACACTCRIFPFVTRTAGTQEIMNVYFVLLGNEGRVHIWPYSATQHLLLVDAKLCTYNGCYSPLTWNCDYFNLCPWH